MHLNETELIQNVDWGKNGGKGSKNTDRRKLHATVSSTDQALETIPEIYQPLGYVRVGCLI